MEIQACRRAGRGTSERWSDKELDDHAVMEAFYEFKLGCPRDLTLPIAQRDNTCGFSWIAWNHASRTAGARRRPFSLNECIFVVDSCIEYWHSQIIEWRDHPEIFTDHIKEFCQDIPDACLLSEDLLEVLDPHTMLLNRRVRDVFEGYVYWIKVRKILDRLVELGMEDGGKRATVQVLTPGRIQDEYTKSQMIITHPQKMSGKALQMDFAMGRGRIYIEPYSRTSFLTRYDEYDHDGLFCLSRSIEHLRKTSYVDYLLAGLSGLYGREDKTKWGLWHFMLEYEQELPKHPKWPKMLGNHTQRLLGEASMISDAIDVTAWITKEGDFVKKTEDIDWYTEMKPQIDIIYKIFAYRTPAIKELEYNYLLQDDLGERLMKQWYQYSKMVYNKDLDELFNLNDRVARWTPTGPDTSLESGMSEMKLGEDKDRFAQSGHSYLKLKFDSPSQKVKTRPDRSMGMTVANVRDPNFPANNLITSYETNDVPSIIFKINNKQMKLVRRLFSTASEVEGQGQVRWDDIYKLMKRIGFRVEDVGGSIIRFVPPNNAGIPFNEHRPHPEVSLNAVRYRAFGERLNRRYGWSINWFERVSQDG
ncbi:hypothetical protein V865_000060 [Kwoniella europaea PYCC6329]|uniref:Uncharacterized protein n=1 Tax=Kwoniella europaea PYCC6329 TaxID=1423913 RepID=A0AAX4K6F7_9TREE